MKALSIIKYRIIRKKKDTSILINKTVKINILDKFHEDRRKFKVFPV